MICTGEFYRVYGVYRVYSIYICIYIRLYTYIYIHNLIKNSQILVINILNLIFCFMEPLLS